MMENESSYSESYIAMLIAYAKRSKKLCYSRLANERLADIGINPNEYYRKNKNWYNIHTNKPIITH